MGGGRDDKLYLTRLLEAAEGPGKVLSKGIGEVSEACLVELLPSVGQAGKLTQPLDLERRSINLRRLYLLSHVSLKLLPEKGRCQHFAEHGGDPDGEISRLSLLCQFVKGVEERDVGLAGCFAEPIDTVGPLAMGEHVG
jgi:hypothetical protein